MGLYWLTSTGWMDSNSHWALFPSLYLSVFLSFASPLCIRLYSLRRLKHGLSDSYCLEAAKDGTSPPSTWVEKLQRKTLLTLAGLEAHPLNQLLWPVLPKQTKQEQTQPVRELWAGRMDCVFPKEQKQNDVTIGFSDCKPNILSFTPGLSLQEPYRVLSSSRLPVQSGSRLGKDLRFLSCSCHSSSVFMGKLPNLWQPQLPPL